MPSPTPLAQTLLVCDAVHRDPSTGKFFLLGTFSTIVSPTFPCVHPGLSVFIAMTECRDETPFTVRLVAIDPGGGADKTLGALEGKIQSNDPLQVHDVVMQLKNVRFERPGEYRFQLEARGELLLEKRLVVARKS